MLAASILNIIKLYVRGSNEQKEAVAEIEKLVIQNLHQLSVSDSKSKHAFISFVRPSMGWVIVFGFAYMLIIGPMLQAFFGIPQVEINENAIYTGAGLFGLHGMGRSWEKKKGLAR